MLCRNQNCVLSLWISPYKSSILLKTEMHRHPCDAGGVLQNRKAEYGHKLTNRNFSTGSRRGRRPPQRSKSFRGRPAGMKNRYVRGVVDAAPYGATTRDLASIVVVANLKWQSSVKAKILSAAVGGIFCFPCVLVS